jgi:hypothetical protein
MLEKGKTRRVGSVLAGWITPRLFSGIKKRSKKNAPGNENQHCLAKWRESIDWNDLH